MAKVQVLATFLTFALAVILIKLGTLMVGETGIGIMIWCFLTGVATALTLLEVIEGPK